MKVNLLDLPQASSDSSIYYSAGSTIAEDDNGSTRVPQQLSTSKAGQRSGTKYDRDALKEIITTELRKPGNHGNCFVTNLK